MNNNLIPAIIVDDEQKSLDTLKNLIGKYCEDIQVIGTAKNVKEAISTIQNTDPKLVFLDISLPDGDGFEVLEKTKTKKYEVIFTTAYNQYAVKAFEMSALHYFIKPIDDNDLISAVERYKKLREQGEITNTERIDIFKEIIKKRPERIILPTMEGFSVINIDEIIRCEADNNYTLFHLTNNRKILVSKTLSNFEKMLSDLNFCRVHSKHLVNLNFVKQYVKGRGGYLMLTDGTHINVSEAKKSEFIKKLKNVARAL
ncbi:MAG TPA: LytTR family DNA-binding domain-containing protein [Bacteroidales bacterium]|nr:LytTR family DNA-binding domain-containing protein [Bacteroidales bacterium]